MDPRILTELGEWMALGFYEAEPEPWPIPYGRAFRRLYENMDIVVPPGRWLIPYEPLPHARTMASHGTWVATALILDFNHNQGLVLNPSIAEEKKQRFPQHARFIDGLVADLSGRLPHFGAYTHSNPDIRRVVNDGFLAMEAELDEAIAEAAGPGAVGGGGAVGGNGDSPLNDKGDGPRFLLAALKEYAIGVRAFHVRTLEALRSAVASASGENRERLALLADSFAHCFMTPSKTFLQGLLAVNLAWMLDGCDSIGRFDQALGPLYEQDIRSGALTVELARRLLDEVWQNFERLNGWNMQIGGWTPAGRDGTNALTLECIAACGRNHQRRPNVAFRITCSTPDSAVEAALEVLAGGAGRPALYNDDLYVKTLLDLDLGLSAEDAREVGFGGCTETMIAGLSNVGSLEGELNLAKALELALHDGYDPVRRTQVGPHTGEFELFEQFDDFGDAVRRQIQHMTDSFVLWNQAALRERFHRGDPKLYRTLFTRDCVKNRRSFEAGGARYNWCVVTYQGIANLIDGLAAVRQCVFERKLIGKRELLAALEADFEGYEAVRLKLRAAPKFGNDEPSVDELGRQIVGYAWDVLYEHEPPRGGRYLPSVILFATYLNAGRQVGATPDGRKAFEALTDSVGPAQGRDVRGPTAMLNSVLKLPLTKAIGTPVLNLRFQRKIMTSEAGLRSVAALVRSYFQRGGLQAQISVISKEEMLAAQKEPEKHAGLIVRIGGYSEYFTRLERGLQDSVIERTEHAV